MQHRLGSMSLLFGVASWLLLALDFTPLLGTGFDRVFWFFPPAVLGLVLGVIAYFRCKNKKLAKIAIWISALPFGVLALLIALLMNSSAFRQ
jgi:hypothetical protein